MSAAAFTRCAPARSDHAGAVLIREERDADHAAVAAIVKAVFPTHAEARLVSALREAGLLALSLVAEMNGAVVGHAGFSPVSVEGMRFAVAPLGLAPLSVAPESQGFGIGAALVEAGLARCAAGAVPFVVLLGEPRYYQRFGFEPASRTGLHSDYDAGDAFMVRETTPGGLRSGAGHVRYAAPFQQG